MPIFSNARFQVSTARAIAGRYFSGIESLIVKIIGCFAGESFLLGSEGRRFQRTM